MTVSISLGPNDDLMLTLPSGARRYVPIGPHSTKLLWQILWNATASGPELTARFPAQAVINQWADEIMPQRRDEEREAREAAKREEAKARLDKFGFDDFQL